MTCKKWNKKLNYYIREGKWTVVHAFLVYDTYNCKIIVYFRKFEWRGWQRSGSTSLFKGFKLHIFRATMEYVLLYDSEWTISAELAENLYETCTWILELSSMFIDSNTSPSKRHMANFLSSSKQNKTKERALLAIVRGEWMNKYPSLCTGFRNMERKSRIGRRNLINVLTQYTGYHALDF